MNPLNNRKDLTPEERASLTVMLYGPPNASAQAPAAGFITQQMMQSKPSRAPWKCEKCGAENDRNFCMECGAPAPAVPETWQCTCGAENKGKFCTECGKPRPAKTTVRAYTETDLPQMLVIWNEIVTAGDAFPQETPLTEETGAAFFAEQSYTGVAEADGRILGLYILHPNNVGRCGHICNASYAVSSDCRGKHIGEKLVLDCMEQAKAKGFRILQFNAVVESNTHARHLYERLGFVQLGTIPDGFRLRSGEYANICPYYKTL